MSDGIDKKLRNKKLELRQNIIENIKNHEFKPCFNSEQLFRSKNQRIKNYYIWFEQLNEMSDGSVGRNDSTEKVKFLFLSNNCVSLFTQDASLNIQSNIVREHFNSQAN